MALTPFSLTAAPAGTTATATWDLVRATVRDQRGQLVRLAGWAALEAAPRLASGLLISEALDRGFLVHQFLIGVLMLSVYALTAGIGALGARQSVPALAEIVEALRYDLALRAVRAILLRGVAGEPIGGRDVEAATKHTESIRRLISQMLLVLPLAVVSLIFTVVGLFALAPLVAWFALASSTVVVMILVCTARSWHRSIHNALLAEEQLSGHAARTLGGLRDVVALGATERAERDLVMDVDRHARAATAIGRVVSSRVALITIGGRLPITVLLLTAPFAVSSGTLTTGQLLGTAIYLVGGLEPTVRTLVLVAGEVGLNASVLLERVLVYSRVPAPPAPHSATGRAGSAAGPAVVGTVAESATAAAPSGSSRGRELALHGVTFGYSATSELVLDEVDLNVRGGERFVVVGPSGAGKSTLANLLVGLDRPREGTIRIGGADVGTLEPEWLRRNVVLLPQEAYVFAGPVRENLAYLRPHATDEELTDACRAVGAAQLLGELGGLDATLGSAAQLSEGQKQIITLARAYAAHASVVVLDEATCHLHPERERQAENAFAAADRTLVVIAHRMSSALRADRVALLHGASLEVGTHEELIARSALYADLVGHWREV